MKLPFFHKKNESIVRRLLTAKAVGLFFGLICFFSIPIFWPNETLMFRFGILIWYTVLGLIIGISGVLSHHPYLKFKFPIGFRGFFFGALLSFVFVLLGYEKLEELMFTTQNFSDWGLFSPFWFVLEGLLLGTIIDIIATKVGGEGKQIL
ncbi:hypothetical protein KAI58_02540 [Candidatus Gracilibacteria bacterium]|nr:hypothetical protein [Candidatus Gracilibacteria bacterium]